MATATEPLEPSEEDLQAIELELVRDEPPEQSYTFSKTTSGVAWETGTGGLDCELFDSQGRLVILPRMPLPPAPENGFTYSTDPVTSKPVPTAAKAQELAQRARHLEIRAQIRARNRQAEIDGRKNFNLSWLAEVRAGTYVSPFEDEPEADYISLYRAPGDADVRKRTSAERAEQERRWQECIRQREQLVADGLCVLCRQKASGFNGALETLCYGHAREQWWVQNQYRQGKSRTGRSGFYGLERIRLDTKDAAVGVIHHPAQRFVREERVAECGSGERDSWAPVIRATLSKEDRQRAERQRAREMAPMPEADLKRFHEHQKEKLDNYRRGGKPTAQKWIGQLNGNH